MTQSGPNDPGQSRPGSHHNKGVLYTSQSSTINDTLASDCLGSYTGYLLGRSYPSPEKQSVYSTAPAD